MAWVAQCNHGALDLHRRGTTQSYNSIGLAQAIVGVEIDFLSGRRSYLLNYYRLPGQL